VSEAPTGGTSVAITAEWALWGKTSSDRGYRLLDYSEGNLGADNYSEVLTRYSPGALEELPQVTISWSSHREELNYLALAIHDREEQRRYDADGREIVFTRYFCWPYDDLAAGAVSYMTLYEEFSRFDLRTQGRAPIKTELAATPPGVPYGGQALRVAALLLTGKPVCIVGADRVGFRERLQFVDAVMSLLPYGMRRRLSASTWTSSTLQGHKFRLFFASTPRPTRDGQPGDHVVEWGRPHGAPTGYDYADDYLAWLESEVKRPAAQLATQKQPTDFSQLAVLRMLEAIGVPVDGSVSPTSSPGADLPVPPRRSATGPMEAMTIEQLIATCGRGVDGPNPDFLKFYIGPLRSYLGKPATPEERRYYQRLIKKNRLLAQDPSVSGSAQTEFYNALLPLAFTVPLTYESYCEIEACAGLAEGQPPHQSLLKSMEQAGFGDSSAYLLVLGSAGDKGLTRRLDKDGAKPSQLIEEMARPAVRPGHARILCQVALQFLQHRGGSDDQPALRAALSRHGYLASLVERCYPDDPSYQVSVLAGFALAAHRGGLDGPAVADILGNADQAPTKSLLAAVLTIVHPDGRSVVFEEYARGVLDPVPFDDDIRGRLMHHFNAPDQPGFVPVLEPLMPGGKDRSLSRIPWWRGSRPPKR